ncbi:hypothetical protein [Phocoenobacter skyensis]|uniref:Uncharacterized protein n=1 Tax=Phocoenobacter skyensis TaxID=97481 RepID=A0A1H8A2T8_9PAST|nr:hypothetical protein [Pasteurella skyensis]MDP8184427.1 hypothetical protein [Pasteurella skyensis]QLB22572.1 hypothetical protein A6B44_04880 [Pasteurella skyensis]SEM64224.1 hypothetical protein SAMN05444853_1348 [Pasteurella skyensis]
MIGLSIDDHVFDSNEFSLTLLSKFDIAIKDLAFDTKLSDEMTVDDDGGIPYDNNRYFNNKSKWIKISNTKLDLSNLIVLVSNIPHMFTWKTTPAEANEKVFLNFLPIKFRHSGNSTEMFLCTSYNLDKHWKVAEDYPNGRLTDKEHRIHFIVAGKPKKHLIPDYGLILIDSNNALSYIDSNNINLNALDITSLKFHSVKNWWDNDYTVKHNKIQMPTIKDNKRLYVVLTPIYFVYAKSIGNWFYPWFDLTYYSLIPFNDELVPYKHHASSFSQQLHSASFSETYTFSLLARNLLYCYH